MDVALKTPVAEGGPPKAGGPPGLVPGGAGGPRAISFAKPNRGLTWNQDANHFFRFLAFERNTPGTFFVLQCGER